MTQVTILKRCIAEFLGTFALVFIGCGTRIMLGESPGMAGTLIVHLTFALTIAAMIYTLSHISAAIFNPALTLGFALSRRFPWRYVLPYWVAQCGGAFVASLFLGLTFPARATAAHYGSTLAKTGIVSALIIETVLTFFLMLVNMAAATDKRFKRAESGLTVGFIILVSGLFANDLTGGSMNPARSLGPALMAGGESLAYLWIYWLAPIVGAMFAVGAYQVIRGSGNYGKDVLEEPLDEEQQTMPEKAQKKPATKELSSY